MIVYSLTCPSAHEFDAWFRDSAAYDEQAAAGTVLCPECGSADVSKRIMAPRISRTGSDKARPPSPAPDSPGQSSSPRGPEPRAAVMAAGRRREEIFRALTELRQRVEETCDYVGDKFAEEARRIHYGETDARDIYGETTVQEARELLEEGVNVAPLPPRPRRDA